MATEGKAGKGRIAVILKGYPRLSETFIAQELRGLEEAGLSLALYSMRHPTDKAVHPVHREIEASVTYLPEYLHNEPLRVLRAWWHMRKTRNYRRVMQLWRTDLKRDFSRNRFRRLGQAFVLAHELPADILHLHAHFIHTPASVTQYASILTGLDWTCSAHAKDIWTSTREDLASKLQSARWAVTCTRTGHEFLSKLSPAPEQVHLSYHGLNLSRFSSPQEPKSNRDGSDPDDPVQLVTVCRAVEKKGLDTLLKALANLPAGMHWRWIHIGGGELFQKLKGQAERLGLTDRIDWKGAVAQTEVLSCLRDADLFVLPCRIAANGDRDGLPNVIVEAQSQALACVSTTVSGVPELVDDGYNGKLVPPDDPAALAEALVALISSPGMRKAMGQNGEQRVRTAFSHEVSIGELVRLFRSVIPALADKGEAA